MPTLHEIRQMIEISTEADWNVTHGPTYLNRWGYWTGPDGVWGLDHDEHMTRAAFIPDVNVTIAFGLAVQMPHRGGLDEAHEQPEWAKFPDPTVDVDYIDVFWAGALVDRDLVVTVDGGRAVLPDPTPEYEGELPENVKVIRWTVTRWEAALARVAHNLEHEQLDFDDYLRRAGFTVV